jgi:pimeloyl-ACP methyl ester carboxylesterase
MARGAEVAAEEAARGSNLGTTEWYRPRSITEHWVDHGFNGLLSRRPEIRMVPDTITVNGCRVQFAVSDNEDAHGPDGPGSPPIWAVNIHGYFAGGAKYWRESARLAERFGWRVVNPSLPGFGGSDPLNWAHTTFSTVTDHVEHVLRHIDAGPVVLLGHSMGGAVAVQHAANHEDSVLGILYRDGIATPAWRRRKGVAARLLTPVLPDLADLADMFSAVVLDTPDLLAGRFTATMRSMWPDVRANLRTVGRSFPLGTMLMTIDMRPEVDRLGASEVPLLPEWGCFDRVVTEDAAREFAEHSGKEILWVPGGHSWMLARPQGQADLLSYVAPGQRFIAAVEERWRRLRRGERSLRPAG